MNTCKTCLHWERDGEAQGFCTLISVGRTSTAFDQGVWAKAVEYGSSSSIMAILNCGPNFGCVLHKETP